MGLDLEQITGELKELAHDVLGVNVEDVTRESSIMEDLGVDSLSITDLILAVEEKYGFEFDENDLLKIKTVGDVVEVIQANSSNS